MLYFAIHIHAVSLVGHDENKHNLARKNTIHRLRYIIISHCPQHVEYNRTSSYLLQCRVYLLIDVNKAAFLLRVSIYYMVYLMPAKYLLAQGIG